MCVFPLISLSFRCFRGSREIADALSRENPQRPGTMRGGCIGRLRFLGNHNNVPPESQRNPRWFTPAMGCSGNLEFSVWNSITQIANYQLVIPLFGMTLSINSNKQTTLSLTRGILVEMINHLKLNFNLR